MNIKERAVKLKKTMVDFLRSFKGNQMKSLYSGETANQGPLRKTNAMNIEEYKEKLQKNVVDPMLSFMEGWEDCGYTSEDVEKCRQMIENYLSALAAIPSPTDEAIMEQVKILVLALNDLNDSTEYSLIETDMREEIWEIIQESAVECGLKRYGDDITEEWREW